MNPFDITKAVDYSDEELFNYWVDFPQVGFDSIIKPRLELPMFVLGSKGSGKTHILKHFSYNMQKQRAVNNSVIDLIKDEGYVGIYLRCSGLNGYRFNGRGQTNDTWETVFSYYLELWLSQILLEYVNEILFKSDDNLKFKAITAILELFKKDKSKNIRTFEDLIKFIKELQNQIDYEINNIALRKSKLVQNLEILLNPGDLIFGIPQILVKIIDELKDLKFLYVLDEYENFTENQQKYFNTLIRERKNPTCFKIGSRRYGMRTRLTLGGEDIKIGSEFEILDLDEEFRREPKVYKEFIKEICNKRLQKFVDDNSFDFSGYFEQFNKKVFDEIKIERKHFQKFHNNLTKIKLPTATISQIIKNITFDNDLIIERTNIFLIYRAYKDKLDLLEHSILLKKESFKYFETKKDGLHKTVLSKYKSEITDSLLVENNQDISTYCGFENLVKISNGIPRHFLMIMKNVFKWNNYYDQKDLLKTITTEIQLLAIKDTTLWFLEDAAIKLESEITIKTGLERLCFYLQTIRFSDLPPECSICTFYFDKKEKNKDFDKILKYLEEYSYIIKSDYARTEKFSKEKLNYYQINGLLSVLWKLALSVRGTVKIDSDNLNTILTDSNVKNFDKILKELGRYNLPFNNPHDSKKTSDEFIGNLF